MKYVMIDEICQNFRLYWNKYFCLLSKKFEYLTDFQMQKKKRLQMVSNEYPKLKMNLLYFTHFSPLGFKRLLKNSQKIYRGL